MLKDRQIHYALWEVTQRCNLSCIHCRADASPCKEETDLIVGADVKKLLDELADLGCPTLAITGGEPLLRPDLVEIISYATSKGIKTRIQSNGLLLTSKLAQELKQAGLYSFGIGLDGSRPEINDVIRNFPGALERAIKAIKLLKEVDLKVHVEHTATKLNINDLSDLLDLLESLGVDTFLSRAAIFSGRANASNQIFVLTAEDYKQYLAELANERLKRKMSIIMNCQDPLYHLVDQAIVEKLKTHGDIYGGHIISGCTLGLNMIHICDNGDIGVCTFLPDIILGNFRKTPLKEIWRDRGQVASLSRLMKRDLEGSCGHCPDRYICGGCRARALTLGGNLYGYDPYCWKYKKHMSDTIDFNKLTLRLYKDSDCVFVHDLSKENMEHCVKKYWGGWDKEKFMANIKPDNIKIIEYQGAPIGFYDMEVIEKLAHLRNIQIKPSFQGRQIGQHVLDIMEKDAKRLNADMIKLQVFKDNPAKNFYSKAGFYSTEDKEFTLIMEKKL